MGLSALQAGAYLHHLHLHSPDAERLASFYADTMDMKAETCGPDTWRVIGAGRRLLVSRGPAKKLAHAGFGLRDRESLDGLRARAAAQGLEPQVVAISVFEEGAFAVVDPDGNHVIFGLAMPDGAVPRGLRGPIQHLTLATRNVRAIEAFYSDKLGFGISDRVVNDKGDVMTSFMRGNHEHHNLACFLQDRQGIDHHSYEAGEWDTIRDWCDRFAERGIELMWGPGRHGPGNNLFIFIEDPDGNWIEVSAELEVIHDRPVREWPHAPRTLNLWGKAIMRA
ncbi:Catechol 2,3-dioxygenase [Rhizobiales bacterium GAS191]|nr:Catechol 2,3-dioxygenase [Rhizobiales bacterium GAS113]SED72162.1 Catechol 2,3-dioxygenase [Rhizobiales bacterium GAS191]